MTDSVKAIIFIGPPGVGKSTLTSGLISALPDCVRFSTGELIREVDEKVKNGSDLDVFDIAAAQTLSAAHRGELMDDEAVYALLFARITERAPAGTKTILLDGVIKDPRNIPSFAKALQQNKGVSIRIDQVIFLNADDEELTKRQAKRAETNERADDDIAIYSRRLAKFRGIETALYQTCQALYPTIRVSTMDPQKIAQLIQAPKQGHTPPAQIPPKP